MKPLLSAASPTTENPFLVNMNLQEDTQPVEAENAFNGVLITGGSHALGSLSGGPQHWTFKVTPDSAGTVSMYIEEGSYESSEGPNEPSDKISVVYEAAGPGHGSPDKPKKPKKNP